jgi:type II secretory pathway component PulK
MALSSCRSPRCRAGAGRVPGGRLHRRGMVLVVVGIVILLISLAAYGFLVLMQTENIASAARGDQLQAQAVAASGREYLAWLMEQPRDARPIAAEFDDVADLFAHVLVDGDDDQRRDSDSRHGRFSVLAPRTGEMATRAWRFGYQNESAKLHLGRMLQWERWQPGSAREGLMNLPGMDESTADAILDWIDADNSPRGQGAESDYYAGLEPPVRPRNAVPPALEELLLVRGVTREKLFGVDLNQNFQVDRWEQDLARSQTRIGSEAETPWAGFLTVYSGERDESYDGQPRILLNQPDLGALHRALGAAFEVGWANFVVAYRQFGPFRGGAQGEDAAQLPLDLSRPPQHTIRSPLELVGARVAIPESGGDKQRVFDSPLAADSALLRENLPQWMDQVTVLSGAPIYGRVNVNLAPVEVLAAIPGIDAALAQRIVSARDLVAPDDPARRHAVWLLTEGLVDRMEMARLDRHLTTGGDVARAQIIGYYDARSPSMRFETVVDGTGRPARQVYYKDLRRLGRGALEDVMNVTNGP